MSYDNKRRLRSVLISLLDFAIVVLSYGLATLIKYDFNADSALVHTREFIKIIPLIAVYLIIFSVAKINKSLWLFISIKEAIVIILSCIFADIFVYNIGSLIYKVQFSKSISFIACLLIIMGTLGMRIGYRYIRIVNKSNKKTTRCIILGAGSAGNILQKEITINDKYPYKVVGFLDDSPYKQNKHLDGIPVLGTMDDIEKLVKDNKVNILVIAIPSLEKNKLRNILEKCSNIGIRTKIMGVNEVVKQKESTLRDISIEDLLSRGEVRLDNHEIETELKDKVIMITGGGGSIGSELCKQVIRFKPKALICYDFYENNMYELQQKIEIEKRHKLIDENIEILYIIGSVRDEDRLDYVMKKYKPDVVYHAAAHKHVPLVETSPKEAVKNNIMGTYNTLNMCIKHKVKKFILISTDKAVRPTNVMGATKRMCELIVQGYRNNGVTKVGAVRFGNVLGSNGSVVPLFKEQIKNGGPLTVTHKEITRYFMTIPEAVQLVLQAGAYANLGDIFVLDMGKPVKIVTLAEKLIKLSGLEPYKDIDIEFVGLRPGEKMYEELSLGDEVRYKTPNDLIFVNETMDIKLEDVINKIDRLNALMSKSTRKDIRNQIIEIVS